MVTQSSPVSQHFISDFAAQPPAQPKWLAALNADAMNHFQRLGIPSTHQEEWRYTNFSRLGAAAFTRQATADTIDAAMRGFHAKHSLANQVDLELTFIDGYFVAPLSKLPVAALQGVQVMPLRQALAQVKNLPQSLTSICDYKAHALVAMNTALMQDGAYIEIPAKHAGCSLHLLFINSGKALSANYPRNFIKVQAQAQVKVVESYVCLDQANSFTNAVTEVVAEDSAQVTHVKVQSESLQACHFGRLQIYQGRNSQVSSLSLTYGGALVRNEIEAKLDDVAAVCTLNGLYLGSGEQWLDNHTFIDHAKPNCNSFEVYKGILNGKARSVFGGKIMVRQDAQKIDAKQSNHNLLLSDSAYVTAKPQLEIFADDVKCTHGATIGRLNHEALFYLRSRGLSYQAAYQMLTYAFASEVIQTIAWPQLSQHLQTQLMEQLPAVLNVA